MDKLKIDFIHIGYHKTATTWFQTYGYPSIPSIFLLNHPKSHYYRAFMDYFVNPDDFSFDYKVFLDEFWLPQHKSHNNLNEFKVEGVCEENLSGHFWTGRNSDTLLNRIETCFDTPRIIICIREQRSMFRSLYSNYVKNGGSLSAKQLLTDIPFEGALLREKLCYHRMIKAAQDKFGKDSVYVYAYEEFCQNPKEITNKIFNFIGVPNEHQINLNTRVNRGRGMFGLYLDRFTNIIGMRGRYKRKAIDYIGYFDIKPPNLDSLITQDTYSLWQKSNESSALLTGINLSRYGYVHDEH